MLSVTLSFWGRFVAMLLSNPKLNKKKIQMFGEHGNAFPDVGRH